MSTPAVNASDREALIDKLKNLLGDRTSTSASVLEQHGRGESWHPVKQPDAVCFAQSNEEVSEIVKLCAAYETPVIAFGTGTSLEGQVQ
ncbi:MAG: FAD-binding protein, partial [Pseudomonadota bacterium]